MTTHTATVFSVVMVRDPGRGVTENPVEEPEGVLSPEELDVESSEHVDTLDENRYVVTGILSQLNYRMNSGERTGGRVQR